MIHIWKFNYHRKYLLLSVLVTKSSNTKNVNVYLLASFQPADYISEKFLNPHLPIFSGYFKERDLGWSCLLGDLDSPHNFDWFFFLEEAPLAGGWGDVLQRRPQQEQRLGHSALSLVRVSDLTVYWSVIDQI